MHSFSIKVIILGKFTRYLWKKIGRYAAFSFPKDTGSNTKFSDLVACYANKRMKRKCIAFDFQIKKKATPTTLIQAPMISLALTFCLKTKIAGTIINTGTIDIKVVAMPVPVF
jgi:hypothetical protein